ncbi:hypothetical protein BDA96_02G273900 [Sorghum bicolor]|jgi:hypothetical protein|uniref:Uncharacterized protein n=2 Tax=Sorghum bicolor TaxID=4558 RepID=A0A921RQ05_SORBI|nr:hypothetical protein SORBI_3002G261200 [Sorghum bicolor]KAG0544418.1 hypothetical protein BDA96_02G273900 [Sorghum bicolor]
MRISKSAPDLLKKAVTSVKSKTDALRTKLIILASVRRRLAMVHAMSRQIHELVASDRREKPASRVEHRSKALMMPMAMVKSEEPTGDHGARARPGLFEVATFEEDCHGHPDWINSLLEDDNCYRDEEDGHPDDDHDDLDILDPLEEPSVIEIIRSKREVEGLEFNMDHDIDEACDLFIRRFRSRMNRSFSDLCISE